MTDVGEITIEEYKTDYVDNDSAEYALIDVREVDEYAAGHLPGAINVPLSDLQNRVDEIPKDTPVVLVCRSGGRSARAGEFLAAQGWDNLTNLLGGTVGWVEAGYPTED